MTHFLEVGSMREDLHEIHTSAQHLRRLLAMTPEQRATMEQARIQQGDMTTHSHDVHFDLETILKRSKDLVDLLDQFESDPIIFTGTGSTTSVLAMLERLLSEKRSG